tara:strand:+ start:324 stop:596 length:273 start_codon:yes stop_codon:yes gene_type:complete
MEKKMTNPVRGRPRAVMTDAEKLAKFDADAQKKREASIKQKRNMQNVTLDASAVALFDAYIDKVSKALGIRLTKSQALTYLLNQVNRQED